VGFALTEVVPTNHQATDASRARIDLHKLRTAFAHYWYAGLEHDCPIHSTVALRTCSGGLARLSGYQSTLESL